MELTRRFSYDRTYYVAEALCYHLPRMTVPMVMENAWRWYRNGLRQTLGDIRSIERAAACVPAWVDAAAGRVRQCCDDGLPSLAYLSLLQGYWACLEELRYLAKCGHCTAGDAAATGEVFRETAWGDWQRTVPVAARRFKHDTSALQLNGIGRARIGYAAALRPPQLTPEAAWMVEQSARL